MPTFTDVLANLNSQGFGQGLAQYSKAMYQQEENKKLVEGLRNFEEKKKAFEGEDLKTTVEQLADAQSIPTGEENITQKLAKMSSSLYQVYDQMGAYQNLYQPFITAFATLGDDGVKVANTLSRELGDKMSMLESKAQVPSMALEYANNVLSYQSNVSEYTQLKEDRQKKKDIESVQQAMTDNEGLSFWKIPKGNRDVILNTGFGDSQIKDYNRKINETISVLTAQFPETDKNVITEAVTRMAAQYGMTISGRQVDNSVALAKINAESKMQRDAALYESISFARSFSAEVGRWSEDFKNVLRMWKDGKLTSGPMEITDDIWKGEYVGTGLTGGDVTIPWERIRQALQGMVKFDKATSIISSMTPDFYNITKKKTSSGQEYSDASIYPEILRSKAPGSYLYENYLYKPWQRNLILDMQNKEMEDLSSLKGSLFKTGYDNNQYNFGIGTPESMGMQNVQKMADDLTSIILGK